MAPPKVKPAAIVPKIRRKAVLVPKVARRLLTDQYRARQGNLTHAAAPEPENGTAATEYGERQIHQTLQGAAHTLSGAAQDPLRKAGRSIRRRLHSPMQKETSRQFVGRFSTSPSRFSAKAAKKQAATERFTGWSIPARQITGRRCWPHISSGYPDEICGAFSMTDEQIQRLEAIFWGITEISSAAISTEQGTAYAVTVRHLSAGEWAAAQGWESDQREYLDTLLADFREELAALVPAP